jgi:hypothetical protein
MMLSPAYKIKRFLRKKKMCNIEYRIFCQKITEDGESIWS